MTTVPIHSADRMVGVGLGYDPDVVVDAARLAAEICEARAAWIGARDGDTVTPIAATGMDAGDLQVSAGLIDRLRTAPEPIMVITDMSRVAVAGLVVPETLSLRFVALAVLTDRAGAGLGLIMVGDEGDRELPTDRAEALGALANLVSAHLGLRATISRLEHVAAERRRYEQHLEAYQLRLERNLAEILEQSITDSLTGLRNRRAFLDRLDDEIRHREQGGPPVALVLLDVDAFKLYNDTYGHPAGDEVLRRIAHLFGERIRSSDVLARIGGDEFAVLLPETDTEGGYVLAERLRRAVENAAWGERSVTVSVGMAAADSSPLDRDELIAAADRALYQAKTSGRNQVRSAG